jgi:hypothetical protein
MSCEREQNRVELVQSQLDDARDQCAKGTHAACARIAGLTRSLAEAQAALTACLATAPPPPPPDTDTDTPPPPPLTDSCTAQRAAVKAVMEQVAELRAEMTGATGPELHGLAGRLTTALNDLSVKQDKLAACDGTLPPYSALHRGLHQDIETPSGAPLGGWIDLDLRGNGDYKIHWHMHSSSLAASFDFELRGYLTAPDCPTVFFFHHSGHVSPMGRHNYDETGNIPDVTRYPAQFMFGATFSAAKDYSWGGLAGTLLGLGNDLLSLRIFDFGTGLGGLVLGAIIAVTREATDWLNEDLGPGVTIAVLSGVAVLAGAAALGESTASSLLLGNVAGVAAGAVTSALVKSRPMTGAEISLAREVFQNTIPYEKVRITNLVSPRNSYFTALGVDGFIYLSMGEIYDDTRHSSHSAYPADWEALIHELTHAWQIANGRFLPGMICSAIKNQADYSMGQDVYQYGDASQGWSQFNLEQQGAIVDQWYAGSLNGGTKQSGYNPQDRRMNADGTYFNPYYKFIHDNILTRLST